MALSTNFFIRFFCRYVFLLLTLCLLYVPNYEVSGQDVGVINPDTVLPNTTIKYRLNGNFDYYDKNGIMIGGGRKKSDGSYNVFYRGRIKQSGYLAGTQAQKVNSEKSTDTNRSVYSHSSSATVVRDEGRETIRNTINSTSYDNAGRPIFRYSSSENDLSHIKDPRVWAKARESQSKEWARQHAYENWRSSTVK